MMNVSAPYNFVHLSKHVCKTEELTTDLINPPSQDNPDKGGLSGIVDYSLVCTTPILLGNGQKEFMTTPDTDQPIIPGASLRGMIRNVLEIASFGKMALVEDQRTGLRDLTNAASLDYRDRLKNDKVNAGWLKLEGDKLKLTKCKFTRVSHTALDTNSPKFSEKIKTLAKKKSMDDRGARQVEEAFTSNLNVHFSETGRDCTLSDTGTAGTLVFTGLPGGNKKREFIFYNCESDIVEVPADTWQGFLAVHERQEKVSKTWEWRRETLYKGEKIPVFWLADPVGEITQIGLAMMFKIAVDNSIHDMIRNTSPDHLDENILDLPTRIFGRIAGTNKTDTGETEVTGFKTRVSFGWAELASTCKYDTLTIERVATSRPKPSYVPSYVRQKDFADQTGDKLLNGAQYRSYMNWNQQKEEIRGWKRYPVKPVLDNGDIAQGEGESMSSLKPIKGKNGTLTFKGRVRYHNLHKIELGALIWVLSWGGNTSLRHSLGMGKPYGWGQVAFDFQPNEEQSQACKAFVDAMERWADGKWQDSVQVRQLLAMANPTVGSQKTALLKQMTLKINGSNDFKTAKDDRKVLPEYFEDDKADPVTIGNRNTAKGLTQDAKRLVQEKPTQSWPIVNAQATHEEWGVVVIKKILPNNNVMVYSRDEGEDVVVSISELERR